MSVQSDKWIKKMAKEHGMISPFEKNKLEETRYHLALQAMDMMLVLIQSLKYLLM